MRQNLRSLFQRQQLPPAIHDIITYCDDTFNSDIRGTFSNDSMAFDEMFNQEDNVVSWKEKDLTLLPTEYYQLLQQWASQLDEKASVLRRYAFMRTSIRRLGQVFHTATSSPRDSCIVYKNCDSEWSAGRIRAIFSHTRCRDVDANTTDTFFIVDVYAPLSTAHAKFDNYRQFPVAGGSLFYHRFLPDPIILRDKDVFSHCVFTLEKVHNIDEQCVHVLPMDKVSYFPGTSEVPTDANLAQRNNTCLFTNGYIPALSLKLEGLQLIC
jgi:hypothetical protein